MQDVIVMEYVMLGERPADDPVFAFLVEQTAQHGKHVIGINGKRVPVERLLKLMSDSHLPISTYSDILATQVTHQALGAEARSRALEDLTRVLALTEGNGKAGTPNGRHTDGSRRVGGKRKDDGTLATNVTAREISEPDADLVLDAKAASMLIERFDRLCAFLFIDEHSPLEISVRRNMREAFLIGDTTGMGLALASYMGLAGVEVTLWRAGSLQDAKTAAGRGDFDGFCDIAKQAAGKIENWTNGLKSNSEFGMFCIRQKFGRRLEAANPADWRRTYSLINEIAGDIGRIRGMVHTQRAVEMIRGGKCLPPPAKISH